MKKLDKTFSLIIIFVLILSSTIFAQNHRNCGTTRYMEHLIQKDSSLEQKLQQQEKAIQQWIKTDNSSKFIIVIPVVFHVLYNSTTTNISAAQIISQIDILNKDYRLRNTDRTKTPTIFKHLAADVGIEFCLAHQDPHGNWTDGITRTQTTKTQFDLSLNDAKYTSMGGYDIWDATKYLNIWIVPAIKDGVQTGILGYAQMPKGPAATDGVVIAYKYIGNMGTATYPFNKGRTTTHEIGHWFSLYHIWGSANSCSGTDHVQDTPNQKTQNFGCPTHPSPSCSNNGDMFMNYMDYTNDACMNLFTKGQKARVHAAINISRSGLITSGRCQPISINENEKLVDFKIFPNPASKSIIINFNKKISKYYISILDITGKEVFAKYYSQLNNSTKLDLNNLPNGVYILKIKNSKNAKIKKLIIQH